MGITSWALPRGHYLMGITSWALSHVQLSHVQLPHGHYLMGITSLALPHVQSPHVHYLMCITSCALPHVHYLICITSCALPHVHYLMCSYLMCNYLMCNYFMCSYFMGIASWALPHGHYLMGITSWALRNVQLPHVQLPHVHYLMGITSWALPHGHYLMGITSWALSHVQLSHVQLPHGHYLMGITSWALPHGHYLMSIPSWALPHGHYLMGITSWALPHCHYLMGITSWALPHGHYLMGIISCAIISCAITSWALPHGHYLMGITSWALPHWHYLMCNRLMGITSWALSHEHYLRSVVDVEATLTATPNPINTTLLSPCNTTDSRELQETCIQVKFCLRYTIRGETFRAINFSIQLDIDTKIKAVNNKRSMFTTNNNQLMKTVKTYLQVGTENEDECSHFEAVLRKAQINKDRFTPIIIVSNFSIESLQNATNDLTLDETKAKNRTLEVIFVKDCGSDAKCEVDLSVNATFTLQPSNTRWTHLVVNLTQEINLKIVIKNKNDPSYGTVAMIDLDSYVPFIKAKSDRNCVIGATNTTEFSLTTDKSGICCIFYEPLENTGEISFDISFQINEVDLTRDLKATIEVKPNTPEYNPEMYRADNSYVVEAPLYIVASIALESSSTPPEHIIYDAKNSSSNADDEEQSLFNVTHKILIRNNGPSFLPKTEILVEVPMYLFNEIQLVTSTDVKMSTQSGEVHCHSNADIDPNFVETTTLEETENQDHEEAKRKRRSVDNKDHDRNSLHSQRSVDSKDNGKITSLRCRDNNKLCQLFTCLLNTNLESKSYAEINVTMVLDVSRMYIKEKFKTLQLVSDVIVKEPKHPQFKCWGDDQRHETITQFHVMASVSKINIWIIIGSVIGGLALITVIVIILWKVGFFERTKHREVQRQKRESMRMAQEVNLIPKSEDEIQDSTSTEDLDEIFT
ncbi:integrin alpha-4 [Biomphalaria pfeifferi]|uniref:Integrin alpha-4 n=1 Tax=Biomphalaria pfeifferi TaxID=112525 RepID=A0AAD8CD30_BIOPF|nr:integrin alpha-4 [Biomphalaria pfeifferi]